MIKINRLISDDKKIIFHLEIEESTSIDIKESQQLLCQELEITERLLTQLKAEGIVGGNIKHNISKLPRRKRIQYVLDEISSHGVRGYDILKDYIKTTDECLYKDLITKEDKRKMNKEMRIRTRVDTRPTSTSQENKKELFYTASLLLDVKKAVIDDKTRDITKDDITCKKVISSKCHFIDEAITDKTCDTNSDEEFHSLDEDWKIDNIPEGQKASQSDLKKEHEHDNYSDANRTLPVSPGKYIGRPHTKKTDPYVPTSDKKVKSTKKGIYMI